MKGRAPKLLTLPRRGPLLAVIDQGVASASNFITVLLASHAGSPRMFGLFAILYGTYIVALGIERSFVTDPLLLSKSSTDDSRAREDYRAVLGGAFTLGIIGLCVLSLGAILLPSESRSIALVIAISLPALLCQDAVRMICLHLGDLSTVIAVDISWLLAQLALTTVVANFAVLTVAWVTISWAIGALAAATLGLIILTLSPALRPGLLWLRQHRRQGLALAVEFGSGQGAAQVALAAVGGIAGAAAVAPLKLIQAALGPVNVVVQGIRGYAQPILSRSEQAAQVRIALQAAVVLASLSTAATLALIAVPDPVLLQLLGDSWSTVNLAIVIILGTESLVTSLTSPISWVLRARNQAVALARIRLISGALTIGGAALLAEILGAEGGALGIVAGTVLAGFLIYARAFHRQLIQ